MTVSRRNSTTRSLAEWREDRESIEELDRQLRSRRPRKRNIRVTPQVVDALADVFEALDAPAATRTGAGSHEQRSRVEVFNLASGHFVDLLPFDFAVKLAPEVFESRHASLVQDGCDFASR